MPRRAASSHQRAAEIVKKIEAMHRLQRLLPRVALATSPLLAGGLAAQTPARAQSTKRADAARRRRADARGQRQSHEP